MIFFEILGRIFQAWFVIGVVCLVIFAFAMWLGDRLEAARKQQSERVE